MFLVGSIYLDSPGCCQRALQQGQDFCRIQILRQFLSVVALWVKKLALWFLLENCEQQILLLKQVPRVCSLPGEGISAVSSVETPPSPGCCWNIPGPCFPVSGTHRAPLPTQWTEPCICSCVSLSLTIRGYLMPKIIPPLTTNSSVEKKDSIQMVGISQAPIFFFSFFFVLSFFFLNGKVSLFFNRPSASYITFLELSHAIISL